MDRVELSLDSNYSTFESNETCFFFAETRISMPKAVFSVGPHVRLHFFLAFREFVCVVCIANLVVDGFMWSPRPSCLFSSNPEGFEVLASKRFPRHYVFGKISPIFVEGDCTVVIPSRGLWYKRYNPRLGEYCRSHRRSCTYWTIDPRCDGVITRAGPRRRVSIKHVSVSSLIRNSCLSTG